MDLTQFLCYLTIFANADVCQKLAGNSTTSTTTMSPAGSTSTTKAANLSNPLAPSRLESIKNSFSELNLLSKTNPSDFIFDFNNATTGVSRGTGGRTVSATASNFPGLIGHGVAMTLGFLGPCGINLPHTHPRATEINYSVDGHFQVGFYQENGAAFIMNEIQKNQVAVFPKGAIHFEQNLNCEPATFVAAFNSEDPGVLTIANAYFGALPATVIGANLGGLNITTIEDIRMNIQGNPSLGIEECRRRCGL
ncbi:unnamed protein product [Adineta ricciae]|uniref:Cupin type-1 domain-containing protein n=1 Tax=Adineta ricciae TaxID=249248 RepID=A0A814L9M3_ADIRI|nr:unnamed protein product [Adineta ricciae]